MWSAETVHLRRGSGSRRHAKKVDARIGSGDGVASLTTPWSSRAIAMNSGNLFVATCLDALSDGSAVGSSRAARTHVGSARFCLTISGQLSTTRSKNSLCDRHRPRSQLRHACTLFLRDFSEMFPICGYPSLHGFKSVGWATLREI
jgi:hypothetical protein